MDRRTFLKDSSILLSSWSLLGLGACAGTAASRRPLFEISLAEWSLHRSLGRGGELTNLDFPRVSKELGVNAVEYVNTFFKDKAEDRDYIQTLKKTTEDLAVKNLLIMCDGEGDLGDPDEGRRTTAVENHYRWVVAARELGCHSIRVNARSRGTFEEQQALAAEGLRRLSEFGEQHEINVIVENHGGLSSNGAWLSGVMRMVDHPRCGTLPDFGNFNIGGGEVYDRYVGVEELMPWAKGVSAKSHDFDEEGNETQTDYLRMLKIVLDAGYEGYVGIEYEGSVLSERDGIIATRRLLERVRVELVGPPAL